MGTIAHFREVLKRQPDAAALDDYWTAGEIEQACRRSGHVWRDRHWSPLATVATFLLQVLHTGSSCREAVALTLSQWAGEGRTLPSTDASAYCGARQRLPPFFQTAVTLRSRPGPVPGPITQVVHDSSSQHHGFCMG